MNNIHQAKKQLINALSACAHSASRAKAWAKMFVYRLLDYPLGVRRVVRHFETHYAGQANPTLYTLYRSGILGLKTSRQVQKVLIECKRFGIANVFEGHVDLRCCDIIPSIRFIREDIRYPESLSLSLYTALLPGHGKLYRIRREFSPLVPGAIPRSKKPRLLRIIDILRAPTIPASVESHSVHFAYFSENRKPGPILSVRADDGQFIPYFQTPPAPPLFDPWKHLLEVQGTSGAGPKQPTENPPK